MKQRRAEKLAKRVYSKQVLKEWGRLIKDPYHQLELDTTLHFLKKHLPKKGLILDAGGGPGRYTIELAKQGYDIVLLDITPENLEFAKKQIKKAGVEERVKDVIQGSITELSCFPNNKFDAVICVGGPLSHVGSDQRARAISELTRVGKKNCPIFISVMGRFGVISKAPRYFADEIKIESHFRQMCFIGDDHKWCGTHYCHYFTLAELKEQLSKKLKIIESVGLEGLATNAESEINKLQKDPKAWKNWLEMHNKLCTHPTIVDISSHILIIGKKR
jgi:ubiquinone/menaquinone biosynthesis C-methylase UbiE